MSQPITVIKRDPAGAEIWCYTGTLLRHEGNEIVLEALFNRPDTALVDVVLMAGDRFIETYYTDRWYNIFEIHDRDTGRIKGWYCNVGRPAVLEAVDRLSYVDLSLDLWVAADGRQTVLDQDEFADLDLDEATRRQALAALEQLKLLFSSK